MKLSFLSNLYSISTGVGLRLPSVNIVLKMMANRAGTASALSNPLRSDAEESQWSCKYLMQVAFVKSFKNSTEQG